MVSMKSPCPAFLISWEHSCPGLIHPHRHSRHSRMEFADKVSSVVSMLKGTLDQIEKEAVEDGSIVPNGTINQGQGNHFHEIPAVFAIVPLTDSGVLQAVQGPMDLNLEGFVNPTNAVQMSIVSRESFSK
ncbi:hypothetical protein V6N13_076819 [Hibiscus sabdariffa]|uniref:Uncharacterized protein n=2 Tax=Hibiscus sabdariffa TaxID=183260 RepID=A0ABR2NGX4_9ROSI